jgi:hypothetical protein
VRSVVPNIAAIGRESDEMLANEIAKRVRQYVFDTVYDASGARSMMAS